MRVLLVFIGLVWAGEALAFEATTGRYGAVVKQMRDLEQRYPAVAKVYAIGANDDGVDILALRISTTPEAVDHQKIGYVVVSTHHGNELAAPEVTMFFADDLLKRFTAAASGAPLKTREFTIVPVLNVSGYDRGEREEHGVDPNRDYPGPCTANAGGQLASVRLMMDLVESRSFSGSVTVHGYDGSLSYPWGVVADDYATLDEGKYAELFRHAAAQNGYRSGPSGAEIYPANGCFEDWIYWKFGAWSMLVELRDGGPADVLKTTRALATYLDDLDQSPATWNPSGNNSFDARCLDDRRVRSRRRE